MASACHSASAEAGAATAAAASAATASAAHLVWFQPGDLRLTDNEPLYTAASCLQSQLASLGQGDVQPAPLLLPFFCLDSRQLGAAPHSLLGVPQLGPHRLRMLLEACASLRAALQALNSDLLWQPGRPAALVGRLVALAAAAGSSAVALHHYTHPGQPSVQFEDDVAQALLAAAQAYGLRSSVHRYWGHSLYHPADLPYHLWSSGHPNGSNRATVGELTTAACAGGAAAAAAAAPAAAPAVAEAPEPAHAPPELSGADCGWVSRQTDWLDVLPLAVMTDFRRTLQAHTRVRPPLPAPVAYGSRRSGSRGGGSSGPVLPPLPPGIAASARKEGLLEPLPSEPAAVYAAAGPEEEAALQQLEALTAQRFSGLQPAGSNSWDSRSAVPFGMGEQQGLQRLRYYLGLQPSDGRSTLATGQPPPIGSYAESRMGAWGVDSSAKLSPFLSLGCLSPRMVYFEVLRLAAAQQAAVAGATTAVGAAACSATAAVAAEADSVAGSAAGVHPAGGSAGGEESAAAAAWKEPQKGDTWRWLLMHLGIRDFFVFSAMQNEAALERPEGMSGRPAEWQEDAALFQRWACGQTGLPFVDACMRELAATGWMSNRGRQNVANLLSKALRLDWRLGAELFASLLVDHDWTLNTTNWAYNSGVGADPRDRVFRSVSQGQRYDPEARLIRTWLPELAALPAELAHEPWAASPEQLAAAQLRLGERLAPAAATQAAAEAEEAEDLHHYPMTVVDPATQIAKGPKSRRQ